MKNIIEGLLTKQKKTTIDVYEIEKMVKEKLGDRRTSLFYKEFADIFLELENEGKVERFKTAKPYSRDLRIQTKYRKTKEEINNESELKNELLTNFHIQMKMGWYLNNLNRYEIDKNKLLSISHFLMNKSDRECYLSVNERSYELFANEKLLSSEPGRKLLSIIGLTCEDLCCFETFEPFFHYNLAGKPEQNILIVENKDTFFSLKKLFLEGKNSWFGVRFSMLIYGEGNKITKSIDYFDELNVPKEATIYYFGDFDPEGIAIFHRIQVKSERNIRLWKPIYIELWNRRKGTKIVGKEQKWNDTAIQSFLLEFDTEMRFEMKKYLEEEGYIPQEAVNINILRSLSDGTK